MAIQLLLTAAEMGFGNNMQGNPGDATRTVTADSSTLDPNASYLITFSDSGTRLTRIDVLDSDGNTTASYFDQNNNSGTALAGNGPGSDLQNDQQTDGIGGFSQTQNLKLDGDQNGTPFNFGASGNFLFLAPGSSIGDGTPTAFSGGDLNGDGFSHTFNAGEFPDSFPCLTAGTLVETADGQRQVEEISVGDLVMTRDNGLQPVRFVGIRQVIASGSKAPVVISKGALGNTRDLIVSPNHRMLVTGARVEALFGESEMLVAAEDLIDGDMIYRKTGGVITYVHIAFDKHEIIFAEGAATESLQPLAQDAASFGGKAFKELMEVFPELQSGTSDVGVVRPVLTSREAALLN